MSTNLKALIITLIFWLLILASSFEMIGIDIGYTDEIFIILLMPLLLKKQPMSIKRPGVWFFLSLFFVISFLTSLFSEYFRGIGLTFLDLFLFLKPILLILSFTKISNEVRSKFLLNIALIGTGYIYFALVFYFINIFYNLFEPHDIRFGLKAYAFIAANPGEFLNNLVLLGVAIYIYPKMKLRKINLVVIAFLLLTTLRFKAFVVLAGAILLFYLFQEYNRKLSFSINNIKFNLSHFYKKHKLKIYFILFLSLIPGWSQFKIYFFTDLTPRLLLLKTSLQLGLINFPFGIGAGTFGSAVAQRWYSPIYVKEGFTNYYGLSGEGPIGFLNDNFWPMVYAQYGFVGVLLTIFIYGKILIWISKNLVKEKYTYEVYLIIFFSLAISTIGASILIGPLGILYLMLLGALVNNKFEHKFI